MEFAEKKLCETLCYFFCCSISNRGDLVHDKNIKREIRSLIINLHFFIFSFNFQDRSYAEMVET